MNNFVFKKKTISERAHLGHSPGLALAWPVPGSRERLFDLPASTIMPVQRNSCEGPITRSRSAQGGVVTRSDMPIARSVNTLKPTAGLRVRLRGCANAEARFNGSIALLVPFPANRGWVQVQLENGATIKWRQGHWDKLRVVLRDATGVKARLNGEVAFVAPKPAKRGWAEVELADGLVCTWRDGRWDETTATSICTLPTDLIASILRWLPVADVCHFLRTCKLFAQAARRPATWSGDLVLRQGVPSGMGVHNSKQPAFAVLMGQLAVQLSSINIEYGRKDADLIRWLLSKADTSGLTHARLAVLNAGHVLFHHTLALVGKSSSDPIDVYGPAPGPMFEDTLPATWPSSVLGCLARAAKGSLQTLSAICDDVPAVLQMQHLRHLDLSLLARRTDIERIVAGLPYLETLKIRDIYRQVAFGAEAGMLRLQSPTLRVIDLRSATKQMSFHMLDCPSLESIHCGEYCYYSAGLRVMDPLTRKRFQTMQCIAESFFAQPEAASHPQWMLRQVTFMSNGDHPGDGTDVNPSYSYPQPPPGCHVSWEGLDVSVTSASRLCDFAAAVRRYWLQARA